MLHESLAVCAVGEGNIKSLGIFHSLLKASMHRFLGTLGLNNGKWEFRCIHEKVVRFFGLFARSKTTTHNNFTVSEVILSENLFCRIPVLFKRWINEFKARVRLVHLALLITSIASSLVMRV